jgi:hypothetical protein
MKAFILAAVAVAISGPAWAADGLLPALPIQVGSALFNINNVTNVPLFTSGAGGAASGAGSISQVDIGAARVIPVFNTPGQLFQNGVNGFLIQVK